MERIYVSLDGHGALQDNVLIRRFLELISTTGLGAQDEYRAAVNAMNNELDQLRQWQERLCQCDYSQLQGPYLDCRFISLPFLLYLLDDVSFNESLRQALCVNRHVSLGTRDLYSEYDYAKALKARTPQQ